MMLVGSGNVVDQEGAGFLYVHGLASMSGKELVVCRKGSPDVSEVTYSDILPYMY